MRIAPEEGMGKWSSCPIAMCQEEDKIQANPASVPRADGREIA